MTTLDLSTDGIRASVEDGIALLTIDLPGQSANTMSVAFKAQLREVVGRLQRAEGLRGVILASGKKTFFAGGDLRTLIAIQPDQARSFFDGLELFKQTLRALERLPFPVAVAINGAALGGGWEICLCAHARFCLADERVLLGLPEATLGLLPGAGGVTRMTRLLGLAAALPYLVEGRTFSPAQALGLGLLQGTAADMDGVLALARDWISRHPRPTAPWDRGDDAAPCLERDLPQVLRSAPLQLLARGQGRYPARQAILAAAVEGACLGIDDALRVETRYLTRLATQQVAKNMIQTFFFESGELKGGKVLPGDVPRVDPRRVALHAGMPAAPALAFAQASRRLRTTLWSARSAELAGCRAAIAARFEDGVRRGRMTAERAQSAMALIDEHVPVPGGATVPEGCDVVVLDEALVGGWPGRDAGAPPWWIVVLPSGSAPGSASEPFPGLRFVPDLEGGLVEVVHGPQADPAAIAMAHAYAQAIGRTPILVRDDAGGYVRRLVQAAVAEAAALRSEGASDALIENACEQTDMLRGPFALAEQFGIEMVPVVARGDNPPPLRDVQDRMLFALALEAARCLERGIVASVAEANIGSILGVGYPRWTGGALQYIHQYGLERFVSHAERLAADGAPRFSPPPLLRRLVAQGAQRIEVGR